MDKVMETKSQMIMRIAELSEANAELETELKRAKAELKKYEDMAKKGLEEFKDVGGCWGCGLQLQLNQDIEDIKQLKAECERLKAENERLKAEKQELSIEIVSLTSKLFTLEKSSNDLSQGINKLYQALKEIRELIKKLDLSLGCAYGDYDCDNCSDINEETVCKIKLQNIILTKINEVIGAE